jgi:hypothetical protein
MASSCGLAAYIDSKGGLRGSKYDSSRPRKNVDEKGEDDATTTESKDIAEYKTVFPIAWYGAGGWKRELENKGGNDAVGVRLINSGGAESAAAKEDEDTLREQLIALRQQKQKEEEDDDGGRKNAKHEAPFPFNHLIRSKIGKKIFRREDPIYIALVVLIILTLVCVTAELTPAGWTAFLMRGGIFLHPLLEAAEHNAALRDKLMAMDGFVRFRDKFMTIRKGWAVFHFIFGIITVWIIAAVHLNRTRALLTISTSSIFSAKTVGYIVDKYGLVEKMSIGISRLKKGLDHTSVLRPLKSVLPAPLDFAHYSHEALYFLASLAVPLIVLALLAKHFPNFASWLMDGISVSTVMRMMAGSVILAALFVHVRILFAVSSDEKRAAAAEQGANKSGKRRNILYAKSLGHAFLVVTAAFVILRHVHPRYASLDSRAMVEDASLMGVLPNYIPSSISRKDIPTG